jgi:phosphatidylglycerophosphate synthase
MTEMAGAQRQVVPVKVWQPQPREPFSLKTLFDWLLWPVLDRLIKPRYTDRVLPPWLLRLPRQLTLSRWDLVPLPVLLAWACVAFQPGWAIALFALTLLSVCTDFVDGTLARYTDNVTDWGGLWDPFMDKVSSASMYASWLWILHVFMLRAFWPAAIGIALRIMFDVALALVGAIEDWFDLSPRAGLKGKCKAVSDVLAVKCGFVGGIVYAAHASGAAWTVAGLAFLGLAVVFAPASVSEHVTNLLRHRTWAEVWALRRNVTWRALARVVRRNHAA